MQTWHFGRWAEHYHESNKLELNRLKSLKIGKLENGKTGKLQDTADMLQTCEHTFDFLFLHGSQAAGATPVRFDFGGKTVYVGDVLVVG